MPTANAPLDLHWETEGKGRPVLLIHGFGSNLYCWRFLRKPLSSVCQLLLVDLKGHGASPKPRDKRYQIDEHAELIYSTIIARDLRDFTLIGHSMGGGIALFIALKLFDRQQSGRLRSLVLMDSVAYKQKLPWYIKVLRIPLLGEAATYLRSSQSNVGDVLNLCYHDPSRITPDQVPAYAAQMDMPGGKHAVLLTARQLIPPDLDQISARYPVVAVPTLLVWGDDDRLIPGWVGEKLAKVLPHAKLVLVRDCGHIPQEEQPRETLEILAPFLRTCEKIKKA